MCSFVTGGVCGGGEKESRVHGCVSSGVQGPACCAMNLRTSHRLFFQIYLFFICVGILPACVSAHLCVKHCGRPVKGVRALGAGVIDDRELSCRC